MFPWEVRSMSTPVSLGRLAWPLLGAMLLLLAALYLVAFDQGAAAAPVTQVASDSGGFFHEFFHDARHLLGVPCH
jgi:putative cobalt transporter subunit CbtB